MADEESKLTNAQLKAELNDLLKHGADWSQLDIAIDGNFKVVKLPSTKTSADKLALTVNPNGKRKPTYFFSADEYIVNVEALNNGSGVAIKLLKAIESLNGITKKTVKKAGLKV